MLSDHLNFVGSSAADEWHRIHDQASWERRRYPNSVVDHEWEQPDTTNWGKAICLQVVSDDPTILEPPSWIASLGTVAWLGVPARFALRGNLRWLPESVESLSLMNDRTMEIIVSPDHCYPRLTRLSSVVPLVVDPDSFPSLQYLSIKVGRRNRMLAVLDQFKGLKSLEVGPCRDALWSKLEGLALNHLRLNGDRRSSDLTHLSGLQMLDTLWLSNWTQLTSMAGIERFANLEDVTLTYCKRIVDIEALGRVAHLKKLNVFECKSNELDALAARLAGK